jgi:hypothetical protein
MYPASAGRVLGRGDIAMAAQFVAAVLNINCQKQVKT